MINLAGIAAQFTELMLAILLAPLLTGWVNQCRAWLQNRSAPGLVAWMPVFAAVGALSHQRERAFSASLIYLGLGVVGAAGLAALGARGLDPVQDAPLLEHITELAVVIALFSTGLKVERKLRWHEWSTVTRLLALGMPAFIALAAVFGGAQSLHVSGMDEALAIPSELAMKVARRTQQISLEESGVASTIDAGPSVLARSWVRLQRSASSSAGTPVEVW